MLSMYARSLSRASARSARSPPLLALAARTARRSVPAVAAQRRLLCDASGGPSSGVVTALDILRSVSGARYTMDDPLRASIGEGEPISAAIHRMVRPWISLARDAAEMDRPLRVPPGGREDRQLRRARRARPCRWLPHAAGLPALHRQARPNPTTLTAASC